MRICFFGESFVNGTGDPACLGWTGRICRTAWQTGFNLTCYNLGIRRETSTQLKARWFDEVRLRLLPEFDGRVVFSFGTNDTTIEHDRRRVERQDSIENLRAILTVAKQHFPVLMIGATPIADAAQTDRIAALSEEMSIVCESLHVPYLDIVSKLKHNAVWMTEVAQGDGAHPGAAGYEVLADFVQNGSAWQAWFKP